MCLAVPAQVITLDREQQTAVVGLGGVRKRISVALLDDVNEGDYVLVHVGYALNRLSPDEAERTLALMRETGLAPDEAMA